MNALIKLALGLAESGVLRQARPSLARVACVAIATAVAAFSAIGALVCLLVALWIYALPQVGAVVAPIIVSGVLILLGSAVLALVFMNSKQQRPAPPSLDDAPTLLLSEATQLLETHKVPVLIAALVAGFIAGKIEK